MPFIVLHLLVVAMFRFGWIKVIPHETTDDDPSLSDPASSN